MNNDFIGALGLYPIEEIITTTSNELISYTNETSNAIMDYITNGIEIKIETTSNNLINYTDTTSNNLINYTDTTSNNLINYTNTTSNNLINYTDTASNNLINYTNTNIDLKEDKLISRQNERVVITNTDGKITTSSTTKNKLEGFDGRIQTIEDALADDTLFNDLDLPTEDAENMLENTTLAQAVAVLGAQVNALQSFTYASTATVGGLTVFNTLVDFTKSINETIDGSLKKSTVDGTRVLDVGETGNYSTVIWRDWNLLTEGRLRIDTGHGLEEDLGLVSTGKLRLKSVSPNKVIISDNEGKIVASQTITTDELNTLNDISTVNTIQEQLDNKLNKFVVNEEQNDENVIVNNTTGGIRKTTISVDELNTLEGITIGQSIEDRLTAKQSTINADNAGTGITITTNPSLVISGFDGDYNSLDNKLTAGTGITINSTNEISGFDGNYNSLTNKLTGGTGITINSANEIVGFDGNYNSLTNKPPVSFWKTEDMNGIINQGIIGKKTTITTDPLTDYCHIGINTSAPSQALHIHTQKTNNMLETNNQVGLLITSDNTVSPSYPTHTSGVRLTLDVNNSKSYLMSGEDKDLIIGTNNTNTIYLKPSGRVGIGVPNPDYSFEVVDDLNVRGILRLQGHIQLKTDVKRQYNGDSPFLPDGITPNQQIGYRVSLTDFYNSPLSDSIFNVGIGTTDPTATLHLHKNQTQFLGGNIFKMTTQSTGITDGLRFVIADTTNSAEILNRSGGSLIIGRDMPETANPDSWIYFDTNSRIGLNTQSPEYNVDINGSLNVRGYIFQNGKAVNISGKRSLSLPEGNTEEVVDITTTSNLTNDSGSSGFLYFTDNSTNTYAKLKWIDWTDINNKPTIPADQLQANWNETNSSSKSFILNKPDIPASQLQADWEETNSSSKAFIKNKPIIPNIVQLQPNWTETDTTSKSFINNKPIIPMAQINANWNETNATSKAFIQNKPNIPPPQVRSDWNETNPTSKTYILNRPVDLLPQVQSDWNETNIASKAYIKNKPTITGASLWSQNNGFISYNNIQVYPNEIKINPIPVQHYIHYQFLSSLALTTDSSSYNNTLTNTGGSYILENSKNSIRYQPNQYSSFITTNWSTYNNLTLATWLKTSSTQNEDVILHFKIGTISVFPTLAGWYKFNYDNNIEYDSSGNNRNFTWVSANTFLDSTYYVEGDGSLFCGDVNAGIDQGEIEGQSLDVLNLNNKSFSISFHIRPYYNDNTLINYTILGQGNNFSSETGFVYCSITSAGKIRFGTPYDYVESPAYTFSQLNEVWMKITLTFNNSNKKLKIFKNDILVAEKICAYSILPAPYTFFVGSCRFDTNNYITGFIGNLDDLKIYYDTLLNEEYSFKIIQKNGTLSFQHNNTELHSISLPTTYTYIIWCIKNGTNQGYFKINNGTKIYFNALNIASGNYTNILGNNGTNSGTIFLSDFRIIIDPITTQIESDLYNGTQTKFLVDNVYLTNTINGLNMGSGTIDWLNVLNKPSVFTPSTHTHNISDINNLQTILDYKASSTHYHSIANINGLQTTLDTKADKYNIQITDVINLQSALNSKAPTVHYHEINEVNGLSSALSTKAPISHTHEITSINGLSSALSGKASTVHYHEINEVNGLSSALSGKASSTHNHEISAINGLQTALNEKANLSHNHEITSINGLSSALSGKAPLSHTHVITEITNLTEELGGKASLSHQHTISAIDGLQTALDSKTSVGHTHSIANIDGLQSALNGKADEGHLHSIANITNLQTTLDGKASTSHTHTIANITNLQNTLDGKAPTSHTHTIANITNLQSTLDGKASINHSHSIASITGLTTELDGKASISHTHSIANIAGLSTELGNKAPLVHTHTIANINGLQTTLDNKAPLVHTHTKADITDFAHSHPISAIEGLSQELINSSNYTDYSSNILQGYINGKAPISHTHTIANITGLQTALDGKAPTSHSHTIANITGLQTALDGKAPTSHTHTIANIDGLSAKLPWEQFTDGTRTGWRIPSTIYGTVPVALGYYNPLKYSFGTNTLTVYGDINIVNGKIKKNGREIIGVGTNTDILSTSTTGTLSVDVFSTNSIPLSSVQNLENTLNNLPTYTDLEGFAYKVHTHPISDITNLQTTLDGKSSIGHTHIINDISGLSQEFINSSNYTDYTSNILQGYINGKTSIGHTHNINDISGLSQEFINSSNYTDYTSNILQGYINGKSSIGHTHIIEDITGLQTALDGKTSIGHNHNINDISGLQTALDDKTNIGHQHSIGSINGLQLVLDNKTDVGHTHIISSIDGLQNALDNKSDLSHIHYISHIFGLQTVLDNLDSKITSGANSSNYTDYTSNILQGYIDGKSSIGHTHIIEDITGLSQEFINSSNYTDYTSNILQGYIDGKSSIGHNHIINDIIGLSQEFINSSNYTDYTSNILQGYIDGKSSIGHNHIINDIIGLSQEFINSSNYTDYTSNILQGYIDGKSSIGHTHPISEITNLQTTLDGKASTSHTHPISEITNLQTTLDGKASTSHTHTKSQITDFAHTHPISEITNLQTTLDGKASTSHTHPISDITNLQTTLDGKASTSHTHLITDITNYQNLFKNIGGSVSDFNNAPYGFFYSTVNATNNPSTVIGGTYWYGFRVAYNISTTSIYDMMIAWVEYPVPTRYKLAIRYKINSTTWNAWTVINSTVADTADKLTTARTINGVSFDGSANITGVQDARITTQTSYKEVDNWNCTGEYYRKGITLSRYIFANSGNANTTYTDFNSIADYGNFFINGTTNSPAVNSASTYYSWGMGLGTGNTFSQYNCQFALPRNVSNPYLTVRYRENTIWGSWQKLSCGNADYATSAGTANNANNATNATYASSAGTANSANYGGTYVQKRYFTGTLTGINYGAFYHFINLGSYFGTGTGENCRVFKCYFYGISSDFGDGNLPHGNFYIHVSSFAGLKSRIGWINSQGINNVYMNTFTELVIATQYNYQIQVFFEPINI